MSDDFYRAFDREVLVDDWNKERTPDYRSVFHQDRDRIMFTFAFRRLQAKTQVFQAGEYDFYRTRLTHSMEVANIAKSISVWLRSEQPGVRIDPDLLEAVCLAHDIGHPPFGHSGERVLHELMENYGGFEGNAQTLRILTRTIYNRGAGRSGMSPTRALLDGVLKYKRLHRDRAGEKNHFIYDEQEAVLEFCFGVRDLAAALGGSPENEFKSLECAVMDHADDVAYSSFDVVDGVKARFLTPDRIEAWGAAQNLDTMQQRQLGELVAMIRGGTLESKMNGIIKELICSTSLAPAENFMSARTNRHSYKMLIGSLAKSRIDLHRKLCTDLIFRSSALQQIEFKGGHVLRELGKSLFENYLTATKPRLVLVPTELHGAIAKEENISARARLLCDHLSGMTDAYAVRSYKRLFDADYGSISELI